MTLQEKEKALENLGPGWELTFNNTRLKRSYSFKDFKEALDFVNLIGFYSEEVNHHPEIHFGYGHMELEIWTHTESDLTTQDFDFAKKVDQLSNTTSVSHS